MARKSAPKMGAGMSKSGGKGGVRTTMTPVFGARVASKRAGSKRGRGR